MRNVILQALRTRWIPQTFFCDSVLDSWFEEGVALPNVSRHKFIIDTDCFGHERYSGADFGCIELWHFRDVRKALLADSGNEL